MSILAQVQVQVRVLPFAVPVLVLLARQEDVA
jgi:hypothetical protein